MSTILPRLQIILAVLLILFSLGMTKHALAQDSSSSANPAKKYNLSFPITELGNCGSLPACKSFCADPNNQSACLAFAKEKGFYKDQSSDPKGAIVLRAALTELGCNSADACRMLCQKPENQDKCQRFAQLHHLVTSTQNSTLTLAKQTLGCTSIDECRSFCQNPGNQQRCSDFAKQAGLKGGLHLIGPGGCSTEGSCRQYCRTHAQECGSFSQGVAGGRSNTTSTNSGFLHPTITPDQFCKLYPDRCKPSLNSNNPASASSGFSLQPAATK